jgi:hypothetical protein
VHGRTSAGRAARETRPTEFTEDMVPPEEPRDGGTGLADLLPGEPAERAGGLRGLRRGSVTGTPQSRPGPQRR